MLQNYTKKKELGDFIKHRRQNISPIQVGLTPIGRRRTPGLRREEVASLAGIGISWYTWLEQGRDTQVSNQVLLSIGKALQLSNVEISYVLALAGFNQEHFQPIPSTTVSSKLQHVLDHLNPAPSVILNAQWDIIAWNTTACLVFIDFEQLKPSDRSLIKLIFLNRHFQKLHPNWQTKAKMLLSHFRLSISDKIEDKGITLFIDSMKKHSSEFSEWWDEHHIQTEAPLTKIISHPEVGLLQFEHTSYTISDSEQKNLKLYVNTPIKDGRTETKIKKLIH
ncbi:helix-turn-helix domain-containing protein [Erwinia sp. CPCC 100877]|nr:helix-turn-helix domain-containing protein [Erwinia sp. CPCC 100877]